MSDDTQAAFHAALAAHIPGTDAGLDELRAAAEAHASAARPTEEIIADYAPLLDDGATYDPAEFAALAEELQAARQARSITEGNLPGFAPAVTTEG